MLALNENFPAPVTFSEAWDFAWNNRIKFLKKSEYEELRYRKHLEPLIGRLMISAITPLRVEQLKNHFLSEGLRPQTVTHIIGLIRRTFNLLIVWGFYTQVNPVSIVKLPREDNRRTRFLTPHEAKELLCNLKERSEITWQISLLCLTAGLRPGEIFKLKGEHIDIANRKLHVTFSKNGKARTVYIPEVTADMLKSKNIKAGQLAFTYSGNKQIKAISDTFTRVVKKMGFNIGISDPKDRLVFYSLRHTYASWMAQDGQPLALLSDLMGHSSVQMTMRYIHLSPERKRAATATIDRIFENIHGNEVLCKENMQIHAKLGAIMQSRAIS